MHKYSDYAAESRFMSNKTIDESSPEKRIFVGETRIKSEKHSPRPKTDYSGVAYEQIAGS
jgi:hypothetical protein